MVSGSGSNLQAILDAQKAESLGAEVRLVISNIAGVRALDRARDAGVSAEVISHRDFSSREEFDARLIARLKEHGIELVVLAGFMRLLTPKFIESFQIINIHPALLPSFPGVHAAKQALDHGAKITGCTVHFVDSGCDTGPIIAQRAVPILDGDDEETLGARIQAEEHRLLPAVISAIAHGRVRLVSGSRRVEGSV